MEMEGQFAKMRRVKKQIAEIDRALEKIASGSYGLCDSCGQQIPQARLEALPQTSFCLSCKAKLAS
jgi:RNA polymerase-binding transcription factor DksA